MKKFFFLLLNLFLHLSFSNVNAQTGWYQQVSGTDQGLYGIHFSDSNNGTVVGISGTILRTSNGGSTWVQQASGTDLVLFDIFLSDENTGTAVGLGGIILRTTNGGETWVPQSNGNFEALFSVFFSDLNNGIAVGHFGTILKTTNGGINWVQQSSGTTAQLRKVYFTDSVNGFIAGSNGTILFTNDGGNTWVQQFGGIQINLLGVSFTDINNGVVVGGSNLTGAGIFRTTNGGQSWMQQHSISFEALTDVHFTDSQTGTAVGWNGIILRTTDGGITWVTQNSNSTSYLTSVYFVNSNIGYAVGSSGTILATMDGGIPVELTSFTASVNGNDVTLNWSTASEINNMGFEVERSQISKLKSQMWEKIGFVHGNGTTTEIQNFRFKDIGVPSGNYSYRLKQIDFDGSFEYLPDRQGSNAIEVDITQPAEFSLGQNYPNPFNPETKIKYAIPSGGLGIETAVQLKIYDVLGNEVAALVNEEKLPGEYQITFDGSGLVSGIYFYSLNAGNFSETKKMILLR